MKLSPAYHLRTNKAVERLLFLELLRKLDGHIPISKYKYVSLGGPYLEDFSLIHSAFGNRDMTSLEIKEHVRSRQRINQPHSQINLTLDSTTKFVDAYQTGRKPLIVWFDYEYAQWKDQITESCDLLQKMPSMSIFKITLACSTNWLGGGPKDPLEGRAKALTDIFGNYGVFSAGDVNHASICRTVYRILRAAIAESSPDTNRRSVRSLASYQYNDGTPILTSTMIIGPLSRIDPIMTKLQDWSFADLNWSGPRPIAIPSLSLREKLAVDRLLPKASAKQIIKQLNFQLAEKETDSLEAMENYVEFYGHAPQFLRVTF